MVPSFVWFPCNKPKKKGVQQRVSRSPVSGRPGAFGLDPSLECHRSSSEKAFLLEGPISSCSLSDNANLSKMQLISAQIDSSGRALV